MKARTTDAWRLAYDRGDEESAESRTTPVGYCVLPNLRDPRLFIDDAGWQWVTELASPTRLTRFLTWRALASAGRLRATRRFLPHFTVPDACHRRLLEELAGGPIESLSLLVGSAGPEQKVVAQIVSGGVVTGYVKMSDDDAGTRLLSNERDVLRGLSTSSAEAVGPQLLVYRQVGERTYLYTEALRGRPVRGKMTEGHADFLRALRRAPVRALETGVFRRIEVASYLLPTLSRLWAPTKDLIAPLELCGAITQGDFTPWNLRRTGAKVRAVDWEYGTLEGIAGLDAVHFRTNTALLLEHRDAVGVHALLTGYINGTDRLIGFSELYQRRERHAVAVLSMLFDVATGLIATGGVLSPTNETKLLLARALLQ